jgi:hypothetical protein
MTVQLFTFNIDIYFFPYLTMNAPENVFDISRIFDFGIVPCANYMCSVNLCNKIDFDNDLPATSTD